MGIQDLRGAVAAGGGACGLLVVGHEVLVETKNVGFFAERLVEGIRRLALAAPACCCRCRQRGKGVVVRSDGRLNTHHARHDTLRGTTRIICRPEELVRPHGGSSLGVAVITLFLVPCHSPMDCLVLLPPGFHAHVLLRLLLHAACMHIRFFCFFGRDQQSMRSHLQVGSRSRGAPGEARPKHMFCKLSFSPCLWYDQDVSPCPPLYLIFVLGPRPTYNRSMRSHLQVGSRSRGAPGEARPKHMFCKLSFSPRSLFAYPCNPSSTGTGTGSEAAG